METSLTELLKHKGSKVYSVEPEATVEAASKLMTETRSPSLAVAAGDANGAVLSN